MLWNKAIGAGGAGKTPYPGVGALLFDHQVTSPTSGLRDIYIRPGGSEISTTTYGDPGFQAIYPMTTPFDLSTIGGALSTDTSSNMLSSDFADNGTKVVLTFFSGNEVYVLNSAAPYRYPSTFDIFSQEGLTSGPYHVRMGSDGRRFWWNDVSERRLYQRDIPVERAPFDVAWSSTTVSVSYTGLVAGWDINSTGEYVLMADAAGLLRQFTLTTPFDITTMTSLVTRDMSANVAVPYSVRFAEDGQCVMVLDRVANTITKYRW